MNLFTRHVITIGAVAAISFGIKVFLDRLVDSEFPEPTPGKWLLDYSKDWRKAFNKPEGFKVTSGFVLGKKSGRFIWATNTPEWDRGWFEEHGMRFPKKWVVYEALRDYGSNSNDPIRLEGL